MKKLHGFALLGAAALVLAACGSSDGNSTPVATTPTPVVTSDVPSSATDSVAGLLTYTTQQVGTTNDTSEPLLVGDAVLPVDNTTETSL
jgi:ABC-type glycerol-3-phosphate transport system substrate-binding protein